MNQADRGQYPEPPPEVDGIEYKSSHNGPVCVKKIHKAQDDINEQLDELSTRIENIIELYVAARKENQTAGVPANEEDNDNELSPDSDNASEAA